MEVVGFGLRLQVKRWTGPRGPNRGPAIFLRGKLCRRQAAERAVRAELVVVFAVGFDQFAGVRQVDKFVFVEAFVAELPV